MKIALIGLSLFLFSSCEPDYQPTALVGEWKITWITSDEIRSGIVKLRSDHTGFISVSADPQSQLIPKAEHIYITWQEQATKLCLNRLDNSFTLEYDILKKSENSIEMFYTSDLMIHLTR